MGNIPIALQEAMLLDRLHIVPFEGIAAALGTTSRRGITKSLFE